MKVLITGHSGLIGSHLARRCVQEGHVVSGISRTSRNLVNGVTDYYFDLTDTKKAKSHIEFIQPEIVFHLAANAAEGASAFSPIEITTTGINTFLNVLVPSITAGKLQKINFTSSIAVYGAITVPFREQDLPLPQDVYGVVKLSIERMIRILSSVHGFKYSITRPHNVYGPGQRMDDLYRNVVTLFMNHLLKKQPYTIYGDGSMERAYSYVEDVVDVIYKAGVDEKTGLTLNVGSDTAYSLNELSNIIQEAAGIHIEPQYLPSRVHEVHTAISDHTIARELYGYADTPINIGLHETWKYCKKKGPAEYEEKILEITSPKVPMNWQHEKSNHNTYNTI